MLFPKESQSGMGVYIIIPMMQGVWKKHTTSTNYVTYGFLPEVWVCSLLQHTSRYGTTFLFLFKYYLVTKHIILGELILKVHGRNGNSCEVSQRQCGNWRIYLINMYMNVWLISHLQGSVWKVLPRTLFQRSIHYQYRARSRFVVLQFMQETCELFSVAGECTFT